MEESNIFSLIIGALALAQGALKLDPAAFVAIEQAPAGVALIVLFLAGLSDVLGQSVTLLANRVKPGRFVLSIIASVLALVFSVIFWAGTIWFSADFFFEAERPFINVLRDVELSYAPLLFGIFVFLPYLGNYIFRLLRIWTLLALLVAVQVGYSFTFWQALLCCALGWIVYELLTRLPVLQPKRLSQWWWRVTTGTPEPVDIQAKADELAEQGRLLLTKRTANVTEGEK